MKQNMWGGMELEPEGAIFSLIILFFAILSGLNFRNQQAATLTSSVRESGLSDEDRKLVVEAINSKDEHRNSSDKSEPKVIVLNQESKSAENSSSKEVKSGENNQIEVNDPYGLAHNPYFAYPPDYYYDDDDDDEYEEDWEDDEEWEEEGQ